jgi:hypothetical protein
MKAREHRRKVREAEYNALRQKRTLDHWKQVALQWRVAAAAHGSIRALNEINFEEASKNCMNEHIKNMYGDVNYTKGMVGLEKMLEFMELSANHIDGSEFNVAFLGAPCAEDK